MRLFKNTSVVCLGGISPMTKLAVRVLLFGVLGVSTLAAQAPTADFISQVPFLQRVLTGSIAAFTSDTAFVPFVSTVMPVIPGTHLVSVRFSAESNCFEADPTSGWCSVRISIGGVEAEPVHGTDFAFDSTDSGAEGGGAWESHSMDRHLCVTNDTGAIQNVPVLVEWGIAFPDPTPASFRIDDWSLVIQESQNCFIIPVSNSDSTEESQVP